MSRFVTKLVIAVLWFGNMCPAFAMPNVHHEASYDQVLCNDASSRGDNHCLVHHDDSVSFVIASNNYKSPSFENLIFSPEKTSLLLDDGQLGRYRYLENTLITETRLLGTVIKRE